MQRLTLHAAGGMTAIKHIGHQGVAQVRHVHAYLMCAARMQAAAHETELCIAFEQLDIGTRNLARMLGKGSLDDFEKSSRAAAGR